jgi:hypothetical protein
MAGRSSARSTTSRTSCGARLGAPTSNSSFPPDAGAAHHARRGAVRKGKAARSRRRRKTAADLMRVAVNHQRATFGTLSNDPNFVDAHRQPGVALDRSGAKPKQTPSEKRQLISNRNPRNGARGKGRVPLVRKAYLGRKRWGAAPRLLLLNPKRRARLHRLPKSHFRRPGKVGIGFNRLLKNSVLYQGTTLVGP